jgi:hypothetical protein
MIIKTIFIIKGDLNETIIEDNPILSSKCLQIDKLIIDAANRKVLITMIEVIDEKE